MKRNHSVYVQSVSEIELTTGRKNTIGWEGEGWGRGYLIACQEHSTRVE